MKTLVIYDTFYGYTEKIARAIGAAVEGEVKVVKVGEAAAGELADYDFIFVGSPTQGGRHTKTLQAFLNELPAEALKGKQAAAFDTRMKSWWVKVFGWAANHIADVLKEKGASVVAPGEGFLVKTGKGPLVDGEEERAGLWAKRLADEVQGQVKKR
jgi:flavodoxin